MINYIIVIVSTNRPTNWPLSLRLEWVEELHLIRKSPKIFALNHPVL